MENNNNEFFLFYVNGYFYLKDKGATLEDIKNLENKLIDFLNENGYHFCGFSQIEEEE